MTQQSGDEEERILTIERAIWQLDWRGVQTRLTALEQQIAQWRPLFAPPPPPPTTTFSGIIHGCNSKGLAGETVTINPHGSSTPITTVTTDANGNFSGSLTLSGPTESVDIVINDVHFNPSTTTQTWTSGVNNNVGTITLTPAAGYVCFAACAYPLPTTIHVVDSIYGTFAATYASGTWTASSTVNYVAFGGCSAVAACPVSWKLATSGSCSVTYKGTSLGGCPADSTGLNTGGSATAGAASCPPSFSSAFTISLGPWNSGATLTWTV